MCSGVLKVMVLPVPSTEAICLISLVGRSVRENQLKASWLEKFAGGVNGSSVCWGGLWSCHTTRKSGDAHTCPRVGALSVCQPAPERSSTSTYWPAVKPLVLATETVKAPLAPSAVKLVEAPVNSTPSLSLLGGP